jgi:DMSO/TMAO reductase YedYZ molybdopterin-dependent catalytic subunit
VEQLGPLLPPEWGRPTAEEAQMAGPTRGFIGRRRREERDPRLPPGQYDTGSDFPVLTAEVTPRLDPATWSITVDGLVATPTTWSWDEVHALPASEYVGDIHCVTTWSKLGTRFGGVSVDVLLDTAAPLAQAAFVLATSTTGYTTNLPLDDLRGGRAWLVWTHEGAPLPPDHGGPVRLLVPHLYFWKSAKWVTRLTLLDHDQPGFWEVNGYHDRGDPWREQRYQGD